MEFQPMLNRPPHFAPIREALRGAVEATHARPVRLFTCGLVWRLRNGTL